jgi:nucleoside-diphosphate-sugar epimerase
MKVLILGASGFLGRRLYSKLEATDWVQATGASRGRRKSAPTSAQLSVDVCDLEALTRALMGHDCVINCVAGDFDSIANGAQKLVRAALDTHCKRIIHLSSMAVYGRTEGYVSEAAALDPGLGWYARAKCEAENHLIGFARNGGEVVILRPGCIFGWGSELWVGRLGRWLRAGRLGDLGSGGDGWSNLVNLDDVCEAILAAMRLPVSPADIPVFNLAAPDSPRWNEYFVDLAIAINATPVRRISARHLKMDSVLAGPPLKLTERLLDRLSIQRGWLPDPMPPGLVRLWAQDIRLSAHAATGVLALEWTGYEKSLKQSADWFIASKSKSPQQETRIPNDVTGK